MMDFNDPQSVRVLDAATIQAVESEVSDAKSRGWLQNDLKRWFASKSVAHADYKTALSGGSVSVDVAGTLTQVSITGLPLKPQTPNRADIKRHIEWLIEPARGDYDDALFEIAYDVPAYGTCNASRLFDFTEVDEAVEFAAKKSESGVNVYIAAALKLPDTPRNHRCRGDFFYVATAVPIDIDDDYDATRAAMASVCDDGLVVTTGIVPDRRSQHWTRLVEPIDNEADFVHAFAALVVHTNADAKVKDGARIMRLGGTVAYPHEKKQAKGYCTELTSVAIKTDARPTDIERLKALEPAPLERQRHVEREAGASGEIETDWIGRVTDGRESHFRNLLLKHLRAYQESTGADPSAQEIFDDAFAEFSDPQKVDNKDGRWTSESGKQQLMARAQNTLRRLQTGRLAKIGLYSVDTGVGQEQAEAVRAEREARFQAPEAVPATMTEYRAMQAENPPEEASEPSFMATPYAWVDPSHIPPRDVLYGKHYYRKFLSATVSPGGLGKSSNAVVEALAMVTNRDLLNEQPQKALSVWYWNGEDPMEELQRRVAAACLHYKIGPDDLGGRLYVDSGRDKEIVIAKETRGEMVIAFPLVEKLTQEIKARGIDVLIIDPFVASHAVNENDNSKIEGVVRQWMRVAEEGGCAIELVHHVRKGNGQNETTVEDGRGAGALLAKVRSARVLNGMGKTEAQEIGIEEKERFGFFKVETGKANLAPRGDGAVWRKMVGVPLGNRVNALEDEVGVPTVWQKPDAMAMLKDHHRVAAVRLVQAGEWREDVRAGNWVGHAVAQAMELDLDDPKDKNTVKKVVHMWCRTGVFKVIQQQDAQRKMRAFVIAPDPDD